MIQNLLKWLVTLSQTLGIFKHKFYSTFMAIWYDPIQLLNNDGGQQFDDDENVTVVGANFEFSFVSLCRRRKRRRNK